MRYSFTCNLEAENVDDIIQQVDNAIVELKEVVSKRKDPFGDVDDNLTGSGWDLELLDYE